MMLTHDMTLMALVLFFALKYRQAKRKFKMLIVVYSSWGLFFIIRGIDLLEQLLHFKHMVERIIKKESQFGHAP